MGQYYKALLERNNKVHIYEPIDGYKLTEHSWFRNDFMSAVAKKIYKKPTKVIWVGDYATDEELQSLNTNFTLDNTFYNGSGISCKTINRDILKNKFLVNHDKKIYIDLNRYFIIADEFNNTLDKGWVLNPISLLTALGNDRGGGDYHEGNRTTCFNAVGTWAYDSISLEDKPIVDYVEEKHIVFTESVTNDNKYLIKEYSIKDDFKKELV